MKKLVLLIPLCIIIFAFSYQEKETENTKAKNVILLIGDGMGLSQVSTVFFFKDQNNFIRFPNVGLITTSSATDKITDSAAGATAFSCGKKSYNGAIGVDTEKVDILNITEKVSRKDIATGIISTSSITHATPACFYAHAESRRMEEEIAEQLVHSEIDFFAGGGMKFFNDRSDGKNLLEVLKQNGFELYKRITSPIVNNNTKPAYLLSEKGLDSKLEGREDFLSKASSLAIEHLSKNENGFFLMIEASQVDWEGHSANVEGTIEEMKDFDDAIGVVMDFAEKNGETLVVVTADHETGGFALQPEKIDGKYDYNTIEGSFYEGTADDEYAAHTATLVPVFSYGPNSDLFNGIYDNTEIFHKMLKAAGWKNY